ncbi:hypothetical protein KAR91_15205 [Candidatus Pacearchaeota archaeon]|nr:hypothetical protein [Candidatus Pacearchaeota archaeon]
MKKGIVKLMVLLSVGIFGLGSADCVTVSPKFKEAQLLVELARKECQELLKLPKGNSREVEVAWKQAKKRCEELTELALEQTGKAIMHSDDLYPSSEK